MFFNEKGEKKTKTQNPDKHEWWLMMARIF